MEAFDKHKMNLCELAMEQEDNYSNGARPPEGSNLNYGCRNCHCLAGSYQRHSHLTMGRNSGKENPSNLVMGSKEVTTQGETGYPHKKGPSSDGLWGVTN